MGVWKSNKDSQSEAADINDYQSIEELLERAQVTWNQSRQTLAQIEKDYPSEEVATGRVPVRDRLDEPNVDEQLRWTPANLFSEILNLNAKQNMPRLRELILAAEDTDFSPEESAQLAPWLLSFATTQRDSNDPEDEAAAWSAIRTGASMLSSDDADLLRTLLKPGRLKGTSFVTLKMVGRIFEAQPPADVDQHAELAADVLEISEGLLNIHAIEASESAAMAHLAIYALAAMGRNEIVSVVETVRKLNVSWFTRRTSHKLHDLREIWQQRSTPISDGLRQLLDHAIQSLDQK